MRYLLIRYIHRALYIWSQEKKVISTVDLKEMFHEEPDYQEISAAQIQADLEAEEKKNEWAKAKSRSH